MPDAVRFTKFSEQTKVARTYELEGAPATTLLYSLVTIRPVKLRLTITDGSVSEVYLAGPKVKKDGTDGQVVSSGSYHSRRDYPSWIVTFLEGMGL